jgi:hypothetical protein
MKIIINKTTKQVLAATNANITLNEDVAYVDNVGGFKLHNGLEIQDHPTETVPTNFVPDFYAFTGTQWTETSFKQKFWENIRQKRDQLLTNSDWTQMPDANLTTEEKAEWTTYRQTLRDITNTTNPLNVTFPNPPGYVDPTTT